VPLKRVVLVGVAILVIIVGLNVTKLPKWQTSITSSRESRLEYWDIALHVIRDNFWTGIGIKTWETDYVHLIEKYRTDPPINWVSPQPHNVYLDAFVKAGLPGFFAIMAFLLWPVAEGFAYAKSYASKNPTWWYGLSLFGVGIALLIFGLIDDPLWSDDVMPLFAIFFGFLAYLAARKNTA
ncbi:MAG TPA: O-antigen ligase family protein, partial [Patescibacteria group bacterium]